VSPERSPDHENVPLFDLAPAESTARDALPHKGQRSARQGCCPRCPKEKIGLLLDGEHLYWRPHRYRTWGTARVFCSATGLPVCEAPEITPLDLLDPVRCPHDRGTL
jgi:hypothetical protein